MPGRESSTLDLVFTREENMVQNLEIVSLLGKSNHCGLVFDFIASDRLIISKEKSRLKMNYFKGNYNLIRSKLEKVDWSEIFESADVEIVCQTIENLILDLTQRFLSVRRVFKHKRKNT